MNVSFFPDWSNLGEVTDWSDLSKMMEGDTGGNSAPGPKPNKMKESRPNNDRAKHSPPQGEIIVLTICLNNAGAKRTILADDAVTGLYFYIYFKYIYFQTVTISYIDFSTVKMS